jgi:cytochrome c biogenesis protein CcmG, thiol:disulfide interchange protein DsbE
MVDRFLTNHLVKDCGMQIGRRNLLRLCVTAGVAMVILWLHPLRAGAVLQTGDVPPKVTVYDLNGNAVILPFSLKGKVAVVHFWASWCRSCAPVMDDLEFIYREFKQKGVFICSVNLGDNKEEAACYLKKTTVSYPVFLDQKMSTKRVYGISGVPTIYILDRQGMVRFRMVGGVGKVALEKAIRTLL